MSATLPAYEALFLWARSQPPSTAAYACSTQLRANFVAGESLLRDDIVGDLVEMGIPKMRAKDLVAAYRHHHHTCSSSASSSPMSVSTPSRRGGGGGAVGIFWDVENVQFPAGVAPSTLISGIKKNFHGLNIQIFKAYWDFSLTKLCPNARAAMEAAGVTCVDTPHLNRSKEIADKQIIIDAMDFAAFGGLPPHEVSVCIISSDVDFVPLFQKLHERNFKTISISREVRPGLVAAATRTLLVDSIVGQKSSTTAPPLPPQRRAPSPDESLLGSRENSDNKAGVIKPLSPSIQRSSTLSTVRRLGAVGNARSCLLLQLVHRLLDEYPEDERDNVRVMDSFFPKMERHMDEEDLHYLLHTDGELQAAVVAHFAVD